MRAGTVTQAAMLDRCRAALAEAGEDPNLVVLLPSGALAVDHGDDDKVPAPEKLRRGLLVWRLREVCTDEVRGFICQECYMETVHRPDELITNAKVDACAAATPMLRDCGVSR